MRERPTHGIVSQLALRDRLEALAALGGGVHKGRGDVGFGWGYGLQGVTIGNEVRVTLRKYRVTSLYTEAQWSALHREVSLIQR